MAPKRLQAERAEVAAELARRLWVANGGATWASVESEGSLLALEVLIVRYLGPGVLRAVVGLKHLQRLEESLQRADYEDVPALRAEIGWVEEYLRVTLFAEGAAREGDEPLAQGADAPESAARRLEELYAELTTLVQAELKAAEIAA